MLTTTDEYCGNITTTTFNIANAQRDEDSEFRLGLRLDNIGGLLRNLNSDIVCIQ